MSQNKIRSARQTIIISQLRKQDVLTIKRWGLVSSDCPTIAKAQKFGWGTQYIYFSSSWRCHAFIYQCHISSKIHFLKKVKTCLMPDEMKYLAVLQGCPLKTATIIPKLPLLFTCRSLERPCTRTIRSPERSFSVSRDSHDKQSCPFQHRFKLLSVIRPGLTGPEPDRNTCWGFISTRSCGQSFRPPPHRCIRRSNSH